MDADVAVRIERRPMSFEDYVALPEGVRACSPETPALVVEVLAPGTRAEDTLRKSREYGDAGIGQYWLVDPDNRTLTVLRNADAEWEIALELDDGHPQGRVEVGPHGSVELEMEALLAP